MRTEPIIVGTVLLALASVITAFGAKLLHDVRAFRRKSVLVQGRYLGDERLVRPWHNEATYANQVSFWCPFLKKRRIVTAEMSSGIRSSRFPGSRMQVLVHSAPPHKAKVATFTNLYVFPLVLLSFGVPFILGVAAYIADHLP
jgi:hypothetical protein